MIGPDSFASRSLIALESVNVLLSSAPRGAVKSIQNRGNNSHLPLWFFLILLFIGGIASFESPVFGPFIERNSGDNDQTDHRGLPKRRDAEKDETIPEYADDKDAEHCSEDGAFTTGKG